MAACSGRSLALDTMVAGLEADHGHARRRRLGAGLPRIEPSLVDPRKVETNIVRVDVAQSGRRAALWSDALKHKGVLVSPCDAYALRFVTHRHITAADIDTALVVFAKVWDGG